MSRTANVKPPIAAADAKAPLTMRHVGYGPNGTAAYAVKDARGRSVKHPRHGSTLCTRSEAEELCAPPKAAIPAMFCMCCGRAADLHNSDQGYSHCCNDRITDDPAEHPDFEDNEEWS